MSKPNACSELADHEWLTGAEAAELLAELALSRAPLLKAIEQLRRRVSPERARLAVELVELRKRAAAKFSAAERMFFTRLGLEQATDEWVAAYKASRVARIADGNAAADFCCGIGGDLLGLARRSAVVGVDRDPIATLYANANARAVLSEHDFERVRFQTDDVSKVDINAMAAWHIDPDRRASGNRTTALAWSDPDQSVVERMLRDAPHAAIKLAPGAKLPADWESRFDLEWISRDGDCRQLVAWHGDLASATSQRRATILTADKQVEPPRSVVGAANTTVAIADRPDRFVFDCDPAVLAAHLKGALAAEHKLSALSAGPTYLTGPRAISDPALSCFEVLDLLPLREATIREYFSDRNVGRLEIKKRGVDLEPEQLRQSLKLRGENAATLLITNVGGRPSTIVARRCDG